MCIKTCKKEFRVCCSVTHDHEVVKWEYWNALAIKWFGRSYVSNKPLLVKQWEYSFCPVCSCFCSSQTSGGLWGWCTKFMIEQTSKVLMNVWRCRSSSRNIQRNERALDISSRSIWTACGSLGLGNFAKNSWRRKRSMCLNKLQAMGMSTIHQKVCALQEPEDTVCINLLNAWWLWGLRRTLDSQRNTDDG